MDVIWIRREEDKPEQKDFSRQTPSMNITRFPLVLRLNEAGFHGLGSSAAGRDNIQISVIGRSPYLEMTFNLYEVIRYANRIYRGGSQRSWPRSPTSPDKVGANGSRDLSIEIRQM